MKGTVHIAIAVLLSCYGVFLFPQTNSPPTEHKPEPPPAISSNENPLEILTDTMGVDFVPYLKHVLREIKQNWYNLIPEEAQVPLLKKGKVTIEFAILKDGKVAGMKLLRSSGDAALDRGAWGSITSSSPLPPLPSEFGGQYLGLRFSFAYNPDKGDLPTSPTSASSKSGITVSILPHDLKVPVDGSQVLTATVKGSKNPSVMWSVTGTGCSGPQCGTMMEGLYIAPSVLPSPPSVTVKAISQADPTAWGSVTLQIVQADPSR
jgi:TonB family protein